MFDQSWQFWGPILGLLIAALALIPPYYTAFFQRNQPMIATESQVTESGRSDTTRSAWWKSPQVIAWFLLWCSLWGPFLYSKLYQDDPILRVGSTLSGTRDMISGRFLGAALAISIDGAAIYKYAPQKVMVVAFHWPTDRDIDDTENLQKSELLDIRKSGLLFHVPLNQEFISLLSKGESSFYAVIILPPGITTDRFSTMRQAKAAGAKILDAGAGGISIR
jgi:hypothetical protein